MKPTDEARTAAREFFLRTYNFGKFINWELSKTDPAATTNEFVRLIDEFVETIYTYGFSDGHSLGLKEGKDIEDQLYAKPFE